jgi:pyruvate/2-oxoglutarate dehydrogenase complex dihydrolipoamide dehydrogenase (E3) component
VLIIENYRSSFVWQLIRLDRPKPAPPRLSRTLAVNSGSNNRISPSARYVAPRMLPNDAHNIRLLSQVHPSEWQNPPPQPRYNLVVVGAGTAGLICAAAAAGLGGKVALLERHLMGGDCLNVGCVPSKTLIRSARAMADMRDAEDFGVRPSPGLEADFGFAMERMRRLRARISQHDSAERFKELGVDVFFGEARFSAPDAVELGGVTLRFAKAVIATGARAATSDIPGLAQAGYLTNETVFNLTQCPARLLVIGGGPLGCEMAQAFHRLGSTVSIVQREPRFLPREDPEAAQLLAQAFQHDGIQLHLNTEVQRVKSSEHGKVVRLLREAQESTVTADEILVGIGRAPNVEGLNLEAANVRYDDKVGVHVNDFLQTTNPAIYAAGDVCLATKFTHMAEASARIVVQNALFRGRKRFSALTVPWCTFTDPEIAHVGLYARQAQEKNIMVKTFTVPMSDVDRAVTDGEEAGFVKILVEADSDRILGATIVGRQAGEMINEISLAMVAGIGLKTIGAVIHSYPSRAEAIRRAADAYNRTRLTPMLKRLTTRWLAWTR